MKNILIVMAFMFFSMQTAAQSTDVTIPFDGYAIKGTFLKAAKPNGTAVLIIAGSGPTDRDCNNPQMKSNAYKFWAEHLASKGISSLRYDKLGIAESMPGKNESDLIFYDNVDVAFAVYNFLEQMPKVERIDVLGHSEGSLVGMLLAQRVGAYKYISLAGPGYPANEILATQLGNIPDDTLRNEAFRMLDTLSRGLALTHFNPMLMSLFRPSVNNYMINWFTYDPRAELARLKIPILILQGDNDIQVSIDNAEELATANPQARKVVVKDINHVLKKSSRDFESNFNSYHSPDTDIDTGIKKALVEFILE